MKLNRNSFLEILMKNKNEIINLLLELESYSTAIHEYELTINCLANIQTEEEFLNTGKVKEITTFLPLNLPLYSFTIFCVIPGLMSESTTFRCSNALKLFFSKLREIPGLIDTIPDIHLSQLSRKNFIEAVASISDVVIFTGKYENALEVKKLCPSALFIYNGAAVNPILICESANIDLAVSKTIQARIFNSGQDCAGPDIVLVSIDQLQLFLEKLKIAITNVKIGDYHDRDVTVGKLISTDSLDYIKDIITKHKDKIYFGGELDDERKIVNPTIIVEEVSDEPNYEEFFAPIFYVATYTSVEELNIYFDHPLYKDYAMYISVFGNLPINCTIPNSVILNNEILLDIENGNEEYGGYGVKANFVADGRNIAAHPVLISREISNWINLNKQEVL